MGDLVEISKEGDVMDPEVVAALKLHQERHQDLVRRVNDIEDVQDKLKDEMDEFRKTHTELQLDISKKFYELRDDIKEVIPAALAAIPESVRVEEERKNSRRAVTWLAVGGIGAVLGAIIAALAAFHGIH